MKKYYPALTLLVVMALAGCSDNKNSGIAGSSAPDQEVEYAQPDLISGVIIETITAGGYTYIHLDAGAEKIWIATSELAAEPGDKVIAAGGLPMSNFHSKSLDRTFETIFFVSDALVGQAATAHLSTARMPEGRPSVPATETGSFDFSGVEKPPEGRSIAEIYAGKAELADQEITLRGIVVKSNSGIMGMNWLHLQDGTGEPGVSNDLTVTTQDNAQVGDTILVSGKLATDRDFGSGYKYALLLEEARVVEE